MIKQIERMISSSRYREALVKAKEVLKKGGEREEALKLLVWIYRMTGNPGKALFYCRHLPENAEKFCEEAILYRMMCDFGRARKKIKKALRIFKKNNDREGVSFALWTLGGIHRYGGNPKMGLAYFQKALTLTKGGSARAYVLCGIGGASRLLGDYGRSLKSYGAANKYFKSAKDRFGLAYSYCGLGSAHRMLKRFKTSEEFYAKALKIYKKIGDLWNMAYSMWGLAQTLWFLGDKKEALRINRQSKKIFRKFSDPRGVFYCGLQNANFLRMDSFFKKAARALLRDASIPAGLSLPYEKGLLMEQEKLIKSKISRVLLIA